MGSAAAAPLALSKNAQFVETVRDKAQISGSPVVGALSLGGAAEAPSPLLAQIPAAWGGDDVCARLVTSDGLYEARGQYSVPADWIGGVAEFDFPTEFSARVLTIAPESMAVLVSRGECSADVSPLALASWRSQPGGEVVLMVNSYRADETYLIFPATGGDTDCIPNPDPQRTAFDMICTVPDELVAAGGTIAIEVNRVRGGGIAPPDAVSLELP